MKNLSFAYIYADELIYTGHCVVLVEEFKTMIINEIWDDWPWLMNYFLRLKEKQCDVGIFISQNKQVWV